MDAHATKVEAIFSAALGLPDAERAAFLEKECAGDAALLAEVRAWLAAHAESGDFMEGAPHFPKGHAGEKAGDRIGPYTLIERIGEGGFGTVWRAAQEQPVRRQVALKIIKLGMDTREVIARFEQEREALALMEHPGIARVLDAGATEKGRPFFVMELVRGVRITEFCDAERLTTAQRVELFIQVCQAVQHAHQKGIIHRDL